VSTDDRYQVHNSATVAEQFRRLAEQARASDRLPLFRRAARWIIEELERTPNEFGESREAWPERSIAMRCGFAGPMYVEYAVYESERAVYIRRFALTR
jgi:hypothetical protein